MQLKNRNRKKIVNSNHRQIPVFNVTENQAIQIADQEKRIASIEKRIFIYDTSIKDRRYFLQQIAAWLNQKPTIRNLTELSYQMIHAANDNGRTTKYMYFNEKSQRLYIDNTVFEWIKLVTSEIRKKTSVLNQ